MWRAAADKKTNEKKSSRKRRFENKTLSLKVLDLFFIYDIVSAQVGECFVYYSVTTALIHVSLRYFVDLDFSFFYHYELRR